MNGNELNLYQQTAHDISTKKICTKQIPKDLTLSEQVFGPKEYLCGATASLLC